MVSMPRAIGVIKRFGAKSYGKKASGKTAALEQGHRDWEKGCVHARSSKANSTRPREPWSPGAQRSGPLCVGDRYHAAGPELLNLSVKDVQRPDGTIRSVIEVARPRRKPPLRCALSRVSANALGKWIAMSGKKRADYIFSGRGVNSSRPVTARQMSRLLKSWIAEAGLDPKKYGKESLRRTKALHILNGTGDIEAVRVLLGHTKIESTAVCQPH
jgi:Phage integrase family